MKRDLATVVLDEMSDHELLVKIATNTAGTHAELVKLNEALQAGSLNIRTHHPLCVTPKDGDYTVQQLEAMGKYLNSSIRAAAGLTQKELAARSGIDEKSISSWETGARAESIKVSQLNKLVGACGVTLHEFLLNFVDPGKPRRRFRRGLQDYVTDLVVLLSEAEADGHHPLDVAFRALGQAAPASHEQQRGIAV